MKTFFLDLWTDPAKFRAALRAFMVALAGGIATGAIPLPAALNAWVATLLPVVLAALGVAMPAGQMNPKVPNGSPVVR